MSTCLVTMPRLEFIYNQRVIDSNEDRKTLNECDINNGHTPLIVKLATNVTNGSSPDSSPDIRYLIFVMNNYCFFISCSPNDRSPNNEPDDGVDVDAESLLPGVAIGNLVADACDFLFKLSDIGVRLRCDELRDNARMLLQLIPADLNVSLVEMKTSFFV